MLIALLVAICVAVIAAPLGREPGLYLLFAPFCHQLPERSLWIAGAPLAVCARCAGIYFGALLGLLARVPARRAWLLAALGTLALDWITEAAGLRGASTAIRWTTGCLAGIAGAAVGAEAWREWCRTEKSAKPA